MAKTTAPKKKPAKAKSAPDVLHVGFVWDMSGSMSAIHHASVEGTRGYLADLKKEEEKYIAEFDGVFTYLTVTAFDTVTETWVDNCPAGDFDLSELDRYQPRGSTALNDAIAQTITIMDTRVREGEKVLVVVMTDGAENASTEYAGADGKRLLAELIKAYERRGNWTFVYLGANVDAQMEAAAMGIQPGNAIAYAPTNASVGATSTSLSYATSSLRGASSKSSPTAFADAGLKTDYRDEVDDVQ